MAVEINILYGFLREGGGVMGTINLLDLRTLSWHITHPFAVASP